MRSGINVTVCGPQAKNKRRNNGHLIGVEARLGAGKEDTASRAKGSEMPGVFASVRQTRAAKSKRKRRLQTHQQGRGLDGSQHCHILDLRRTPAKSRLYRCLSGSRFPLGG